MLEPLAREFSSVALQMEGLQQPERFYNKLIYSAYAVLGQLVLGI